MSDRGILMTPQNYAKCESGDKTQTRRIVKGDSSKWEASLLETGRWQEALKCPYGIVGDRLYVKEACLPRANGEAFLYKRDFSSVEAAGIGGMYGGWKSPLFMPKLAARLWLEIVDVRVERIQDISLYDVGKEGYAVSVDGGSSQDFAIPWNKINGDDAWERNDWVWVISFTTPVTR